MSRATDLIQALRARGVVLEAHGGHLRFWPQKAVTVEELEVLREHKAEVLALLLGMVGQLPLETRAVPGSSACTCLRETWQSVRVDPDAGCVCGLGWICRVCGGCRGCLSHGPGAGKAMQERAMANLLQLIRREKALTEDLSATVEGNPQDPDADLLLEMLDRFGRMDRLYRFLGGVGCPVGGCGPDDVASCEACAGEPRRTTPRGEA